MSREPIAQGPFAATWDSLRSYTCPDWFRDAKFGVWAHWGPQCVPMTGDWYARHLYMPETAQYQHHWRVYGHPSKVGYKDIIALWQAEKFDPAALLAKYQAAGAKYFVAQAVHHDNFDNWNSTHHRWNAVQQGPHRNIVGDFQAAARALGLKFGVSEHLGASYSWWKGNKLADPDGPYAGVPYDASDPALADLYHDNQGETGNWYSDNPVWHERWFARMKDLVDQHQPDLLYSDGGVPFGEVGLSLIAHLYNTSAALHGTNQAVYNQKDTNQEVYRVGVLDIERGQRQDIAADPWQTDTCVGGWYYDSRAKYKSAHHVIEMLVDIVAKNGNLLLNFTQYPDGSLDEQCEHIVAVLTEWMAACGTGIYGTRPWTQAGEGPTRPQQGAFKEDAANWTAADFRFTQQGNVVYAFQMRYPDTRQAAVHALGAESGRKVTDVKLLGYRGEVAWEQAAKALVVRLPDDPVVPCAPCLAVTLG